jgi:hypothetical protein
MMCAIRIQIDLFFYVLSICRDINLRDNCALAADLCSWKTNTHPIVAFISVSMLPLVLLPHSWEAYLRSEIIQCLIGAEPALPMCPKSLPSIARDDIGTMEHCAMTQFLCAAKDRRETVSSSHNQRSTHFSEHKPFNRSRV